MPWIEFWLKQPEYWVNIDKKTIRSCKKPQGLRVQKFKEILENMAQKTDTIPVVFFIQSRVTKNVQNIAGGTHGATVDSNSFWCILL